MRSLRVATLAVPSLLSCCAPGDPPGAAQLCIERPEQHASLNIIPVSVLLTPASAGAPMALDFASGGDRQCVRLPAGRVRAVLRFPYPYSGPGEPLRYWAVESVLAVRPGRNDILLDAAPALDTSAPGWSETGWHEMWELRPAGPAGETKRNG